MRACFHNFGKVFWDRLRLKMNLRTGIRILEKPFIMKLGIPSSPTDFVGLNRFTALWTSEVETQAEGKISVQ
jgi:hypothetical protein